MKYVILLGDGMADEPLEELGGKTPLEYARTPHMDGLAARGTLGRIDTIPPGLAPGSDVANLSVLGYDPRDFFTGRGPLEAASMGVALGPEDTAFRCNLVTLGDGSDPVMENSNAGHISSGEARQIIESLNEGLASETVRFHAGVGYRHLLVFRNEGFDLRTTPPHDIVGKETGSYLPRGKGSEKLLSLMASAAEILKRHRINRERSASGKIPANSIWPWGEGRAPRMRPMAERFSIRGGVISAVDLLRGIGVYAGLEILPVKGATGYTDTNYAGKAAKAIEFLAAGNDFVFLHVEAPDEKGHEGDIQGKVSAIEDFDGKIVGPVLDGLSSLGDHRIVVLSDHPTPIRIRTHAGEPSPFALYGSGKGENLGRGVPFSEKAALEGGILIRPGHLFMDHFMGNWRRFLESLR
jgi:2,3-bisphosphoglycerate-independent phosphoglycerate mutase